MSSVLRQWFAEARGDGMNEAEAVRAVCQRVGAGEVTVRRLLVGAGEKLGAANGRSGDRQRGDKGRSGVERPGARRRAQANGDRRPDGPEEPDVTAIRAAYRRYRKAGRGTELAVKSCAREFDLRPHDIRRLVGTTEYELQHPPSSTE